MEFVFAVKPKFTDSKMKNFMVVKAGNTMRVSVSFEVQYKINVRRTYAVL